MIDNVSLLLLLMTSYALNLKLIKFLSLAFVRTISYNLF